MSNSKKKKMPKGSMETFFKVLRMIGNYRFLLILSIVLAAVTVVLQLYVPILFGNAIDEVVGAHAVDFDRMWYYLSRILVMVIVSSVSTWVMSIINNRMTYRTVQDIRAKAIRHIQELPLSYLDQHSTGDIISRVIADTDILSDGLLLGFTQLFSGIVTIVGTLIFMFSKNVWITLLVIVLTPLSFFVAKFISSHSFQMFRKQSETRGKQTALIEEMIGNQKVVQAFGYEDKASERFAEINEDLKNYSQKAVFYSSLTNPSTRCVNNIIYAGVALVGAFMIPGGFLTVGGLSVLLSYANQYMKPFNDISSVITELQNALACAGRIFELLEEPAEVPEEKKEMGKAAGEVNIEHVSFSYDKSKKLIEDFNFESKPGMRVAIVGPTGCGKTTFINLLMRFYDTDKGDILVDGQPIKNVTRHSLRSNYGMVLQDTWIKSGTVRENICIGKPNATDEEIKEAARTLPQLGIYPPSARRTGHGSHRGQLKPGPETASLHHPRHALPAAHADSRRGNLQHRYPYRAADSGSLRSAHAGTHKLHRSPSSLHDPQCGLDSGHERRPDHRAGHPRRPYEGGRFLQPPLQQPVCQRGSVKIQSKKSAKPQSFADFFFIKFFPV